MKPLKIKNYGSIPHLSNSKLGYSDSHIGIGQELILTQKTRDKHDLVIVTEKYDGSNVGIAKVNNKIYALTRSGYEAKTSKYKLHHDFNDYVYKYERIFNDILTNGERLVGEWLGTPHGIKYDIKLQDPIIFFDYFNDKNERHIFNELCSLSSLYYVINTPRVLHQGSSKSVNELIPILNKKTKPLNPIKDLPEGMVYRVERLGKVDFLAKWVRSDFIAGKYLK